MLRGFHAHANDYTRAPSPVTPRREAIDITFPMLSSGTPFTTLSLHSADPEISCDSLDFSSSSPDALEAVFEAGEAERCTTRKLPAPEPGALPSPYAIILTP